jgi:hypothetical protein
MTSKSTKKDYKALYKALKNKHEFVLKASSNALEDAFNLMKAKDATLKEQDATLKEQDFYLKEQDAKLKEQDKQLAKYKKAEKAYKTKFGIKETRLTSQEMKEVEKRAREEEDEKPKFVIDLNINKHWYKHSYCPVCYNDIEIDDVYDPIYEDEYLNPEKQPYVVCNRIRYFFEGNKEQPIATPKLK